MSDPNAKIKDSAKPRVKGMAEKWVFFACAAFSILAVFGIILFIFISSVPAFAEIGVFQFIFGVTWSPNHELYGIFPMIVNSLCVTIGALLLGGILGIFTALFIVYWCPQKLKKPFEQIVNLFAGIPSIIFGFFGLVIIVPALESISPNNNGYGLLACSIVLMLMILPTVAGLSKNALRSVPDAYFEGALALGATKEQAIFTVMLPAARSGVISGLILGSGRAIGETMAVILVCGNRALFPTGLFSNIRTLTTNIALEFGEATVGSLKRSALIATGFILLVFVLIINFSIGFVKKSSSGSNRKRKLSAETASAPKYRQCGWISKVLKYVSFALAAVVVVSLVGIVLFILINGIPNMSANLLFGRSTNSNITLLPAFASTGMIIVVALVIALPIGICSAIYLNEYAKPGSRVVKIIRLFTDTLSGIPSIVFGLFGNILFCTYMGMGYSLLAGSLTMAIMILPTIIRSVEESLIAVPDSLREASLALGASKLRTIITVILPQALAGILTAAVLSIGRIVGESAALVYTAGAVSLMPSGYMSAGSTFAVLMWSLSQEGLYMDKAYATALVLLIFVAIIYVALGLIEYFLGGERKWKTKKPKEKIKLKTA